MKQEAKGNGGPGKSRRCFRPRLVEVMRGNYSRMDLTGDMMAGVTVGMIALPLALALGIASVPQGVETAFPAPALGIFTAIIGGFLISVFGGSRVQIGGPTAAFIPIILLVIEQHGYGGLLVATMMAGVLLVVMGLARMGSLIKYIPWPVTSGFTTGIAVAIMATQTGDFFGIHTDDAPPREFLERMHWLVEHVGSAHVPTVLLAIVSLVVILVWPKFGWKRVPGSIVAMVVATIAVMVTGWDSAGGIATIGSKFGEGAIPARLPGFAFPAFSLDTVRDLMGPALAIAVLGSIESLLSAVVADGLCDDRHDSNTELVAQGIANLTCPLFGGLPVTGAIARTSANVNNGGKSPVSGIVHAVTLLGIVLVFGRWATHVPMAAMSAVLVFVALRMGEWHELARLRRMPASDALVLVATFLLTVIFDLVVAVEVGMVLAAMLFIKRVADTTEVSRVSSEDVLERPEQLAHGKEIPDGVLVFRIFGPFLFGAAEKMQDAIERAEIQPRVLILRLHLVTAMDATALNALESVVERVRKHGGVVVLSGLHRQPLDTLRKAGFVEVVGRANLVAHFDDALARAREVMADEEAGA
ncbi:MAG: SulP family inorganic anion transporter [Verrucomicrobiales bacterium]|nr:SulP family inorganic anion transporter [Verrucomicrobiota bacterium JB025]